MVKFARKEEKPFDPISAKVLTAIASTPPTASPEPEAVSAEMTRAASGPELEAELPPEPPGAGPGAVESEGREAGEGKRSRKRRQPEPASGTRAEAIADEDPPEPERLNRVVRCLLSPSEEKLLRALVTRLAKGAGTSLTLSHLLRPYFDLLLHCEDQLAEELAPGRIARPHNDKAALVHYEHKLAALIHNALRKAPAFRSGGSGKQTS